MGAKRNERKKSRISFGITEYHLIGFMFSSASFIGRVVFFSATLFIRDLDGF